MEAQVTLTDVEARVLSEVSERTGRSLESLIHDALAPFIARHDKGLATDDFRRAAGLWAGRDDVPDARVLREEFDRRGGR